MKLFFSAYPCALFHYGKVKLPIQSQQEILGELTSIPQLKEMLDTLETVMAFLTGRSSGHGGDMNLSSYAESLQIKFCSKVEPLSLHMQD